MVGARRPGHVVRLHPGMVDPPALRPGTMRQMPDEPKPRHRCADPDADTPDHPAPAAERKKQQGEGDLLRHPRRLEETIEAVAPDPTEIDRRRPRDDQPAMHKPPAVARHRPPMRTK